MPYDIKSILKLILKINDVLLYIINNNLITIAAV